MKKILKILFFVFFMLLFCKNGYAEAIEIVPEETFVLPNKLVRIDKEAFAGTNTNVVILPYGVQSIGDKAFESNSSLTDIYIPSSTEYIAETAFFKDTKLIIHGLEGSYAEEYAKTHRIPFVIDDIWNQMFISGRTVSLLVIIDKSVYKILDKGILKTLPGGRYHFISRRPQDRPELNVIDYRFP